MLNFRCSNVNIYLSSTFFSQAKSGDWVIPTGVWENIFEIGMPGITLLREYSPGGWNILSGNLEREAWPEVKLAELVHDLWDEIIEQVFYMLVEDNTPSPNLRMTALIYPSSFTQTPVQMYIFFF